MMGRKLNLIWLDDEFDRRRRFFEPVLAYMTQAHPDLRVVQLTSVIDFSQLLEHRHACLPTDGDYVDLIWLDAMMKPLEEKPKFGALGFEGVEQKALDVGCQILGLMQNPIYAGQRPVWLTAYQGRPTTLLTTKTGIEADWSAFVADEVRANSACFATLVKNLRYLTDVIEADNALKTHLADRILQCRSSIAKFASNGSKP